MSSDASPSKGSRWALTGDGCLMTAASMSLFTLPGLLFVALGWIRTTPQGPADGVSAVLSGVVSVMTLATVVVGPGSAWLLHGRRVSLMAALGGILGVGAAMLVTVGLSAVAALTGPRTDTFTATDMAGPIAILGVFAAAVVVVIAVLDVDAVRDLMSASRKHQRLDVARIVATSVLLVLAAAAVWLGFARPELGIGEAGIFVLAAGVFGAIVVGVADAVVTMAGRRSGDGEAAAGP
jgi:hypothetical protein